MPFLMARSMVSVGMLWPRAVSMAVRSRGLPLGSPPPSRAEMVISRITLVQTLDFFESEASFLCLILDHRLWPDMPAVLTLSRGGRLTSLGWVAVVGDSTPPARRKRP